VSGQSPADLRYMAEALRLARRGLGRTSPNPAVGALVVRGARVVGRGFHRRAGGPHAEVFALRQAGRRARGATLYVTLEPCCHFGRTPPCVDTVLESGVSRVVVGTLDPNPRVRGRSIRPFVVLKLAATLDGRIATAKGDSRWVTSAAARRRVHEMRNRVDAVIVGSETVVADDPRLTCRMRRGRNPLRVVLDGRLRSPESARVFSADAERTRIYTLAEHGAKAVRLRARGVIVRRGGGQRPGSLRRVLRDLAVAGIKSVMIEGGGVVAAHALRGGLVDRLALFLAPKLVGGDGRPMVAALHLRRMGEAISLLDTKLERLGPDLLIEGRPAFRKSR